MRPREELAAALTVLGQAMRPENADVVIGPDAVFALRVSSIAATLVWAFGRDLPEVTDVLNEIRKRLGLEKETVNGN